MNRLVSPHPLSGRITLILALALYCVGPAYAGVNVAPGETSPPLAAEGCDIISDFIFGDCDVGCYGDCDLATNTADAAINMSSLAIGKKSLQTTAYTDFTVTGDSLTSGNQINGTVAYDLEWAGGWTLGGVFTGFNDAKATMTITLTDLSTGQVVRAIPFHTQLTDGFIGIDIIDVGFGLDNGTESNALSAQLVRGHSYRIHSTVRLEAKGALNATIILDYATGGWGLWWNNLTVTVAPDLAEEIAKLKARVDTLEAEVDDLRDDLEDHTHTYLTGRGEGHNNTEAETSPAIIMDDSLVAPGELEGILSDDGPSETLPDKSVLMHNYPNPFNAATVISYTLPEDGWVDIKIYNTLGQRVMTLVSEQQQAGTHEVPFDARRLASGVYYYRLTVGPYAETRRLTLLK